jgi:predicted CopG family antitoxin
MQMLESLDEVAAEEGQESESMSECIKEYCEEVKKRTTQEHIDEVTAQYEVNGLLKDLKFKK